MERKDLIILLGIIGIAVLLTANAKYNFFAVYSPKLTTVTMELNFKNYQYQKKVTFIKYIPDRGPYACGGDLQPYRFKINGINPLLIKDNKCYLKLDVVKSQPCYRRDWMWEIKNVTLVAPYENGICDFYNKGKILNPETSYYHYLRTPNFGEKTEYTKKCSEFRYKNFCLDKILYSSRGVTGTLYFNIKKVPIVNCKQLSGNYCADDKTVETRVYHCKPGYGTDENCFNECVPEVVSTKKCDWYKVCDNGECKTSPVIEIAILLGVLIVLVFFLLKKKSFSFGS